VIKILNYLKNNKLDIYIHMVELTIDKNNTKVIQSLNLNIQETIILRNVEKYFFNNDNFKILETIVNGSNSISRRTIEYFVTKYSNIMNTTYIINNNNKKIKFNVYSSYKDKLKCHRKKYFDPFGRGDRIPFFSNGTCIITTIGQLNFYKWFITNDIYKYCKENHNEIQKSLLENFSKNKKKPGIKKNYSTYKSSIIKNQYIAPINLSVTFDV
jgi:hypothetical protein